jgi:hypothetical protein
VYVEISPSLVWIVYLSLSILVVNYLYAARKLDLSSSKSFFNVVQSYTAFYSAKLSSFFASTKAFLNYPINDTTYLTDAGSTFSVN